VKEKERKMIDETALAGTGGSPGPSAPGQHEFGTNNAPPPPTPGDPNQRPGEVPQDPNEVQSPPPREIPPAPEPNEGDRERA
jgi:hypothetical protein